MKIQLNSGTTLIIDSKPFASGGEGDLYRILSPTTHQHLVLKIYKQDKRTSDRGRKIQYLIDNPPTLNSNHNSIIWPKEIAYLNNSFAGFTMPMAKGEKLELLCHNKLPPNLRGEWSKFDPIGKDAISFRLKLCFNIAVAIHQIHELGDYVIVDMKPENIMVLPNGLVSIIDLDSVQVFRGNQMLFSAPVSTPEYTPPEYYKKTNTPNSGAYRSWDCFSMAVIFYRLLCGIHPYSGSCNSPYETCTGIPEMVENGLFPNGKNKYHFRAIPPPHKRFELLPVNVRELFMKCFELGHNDANQRPSADLWCETLAPEGQVYFFRKQEYTKLPPISVSYNVPIAFLAGTTVEFPTIDFSKIPISGTNVLFRLFMSTKKKETFKKINESTIKLRDFLSRKTSFEKQLAEIVRLFETEQTIILIEEKKQIEVIVGKYEDAKKNMLQQAKQLVDNEKKEVSQLSESIHNQQVELKRQLKIKYDNLVGNRKLQYDNRCNLLEEEIKTIEQRKKHALTTELNDPDRLAKYVLSNHLKNIFKSTTAAYVKEITSHISTAADFVRIDDSGRFLLRNNTWLKLPGVGYTRAWEVQYWQNKMRDEDDKAINSRIDSIFIPQIRQKSMELDLLRKEVESTMRPFNQQYINEQQTSTKKSFELTEFYKNAAQSINKKYDQLNEELGKSVASKVQVLTTEIDIINSSHKKQILSKNGLYTAEIHKVRAAISDHIENIKLEYANLQVLLSQV